MVGGEIKVVMTLDNGQFTIQTQKAGQTIQELKRQIETTAKSTEGLEKHFTGLGQKFHDVVRTASLLRYALHDINDVFLSLPAATLKTAGEFERMTVLMEGMSKQAGDSAKAMDAAFNKNYIIKMALESPFDIKSLTDSFVKFKSAGLDPTDGSMKGLVESVAKFGGTSETLHRASIAVQQMAGKGVISMEELRQQLGEAVPNAMSTMARGAGVSMAELSAQVKKGTVEAGSALKTMFTAMQIDNYGASQKMMDTWEGMLSQLKTRFDLFKLDMANAGFFQTMKDQLQDIIDLLGTSGARAFADDFGMALKSIVLNIREAIEWFAKWADTIKFVGLAMAGLYAGSKVAKLAESFQKSTLSVAYSAGSQKAVDDAQDAADKMYGSKLAQNRKMLMDLEASYEKEMQLARQAHSNRLAQYETEIAAARKHAEDLLVQQEAYLAKQRQLNFQGNAISWDKDGIDLRTETGRARARILQQEADAAYAAALKAGEHAAALGREATASAEAAAALERRKAALAATVVTGSENTKIIQQATQNIRENVAQMTQQAKATAEVSFGMQTLHGVIGAGKVIWNAFGGWVGIAIGVLTTLGEKLFEFLNRWERAKEIADQIARGIASDKSKKEAEDRLAEIESKIKSKEATLAGLQSRAASFGPETSAGRSAAEAASKLEKELEGLRAERRDWSDRVNEAMRLIDENASQVRQQQVKRIYTRQVTAVFDAWKSANDDIEKRKLEALEKAQAGGKKLTPSEQKKIEEPFNKEITEGQKAATRSALTLLNNEIDRINDELKTASLTKEKRKELTDALKVLNDDKTGLRRELVKLSMDADASLGKGLKTNADEPTDKPIDPLVRYVNALNADLERAKLKLKANISEVRSIDEMRQEAMVKVLGDMSEGRFDKNTEKDPLTGKMKRRYVGGEKERDNYVAKYLDQLSKGKVDVDEFVNSLGALDEQEKKLIRTAVESAASAMQVNEQQKALTSAQQLAKKAVEDADAAMLDLASGGLAKVSPALLTLQKQFAGLEEKAKSAKSGFEAFNQFKATAFANQAIADVRKYAAAQAKSLEEEKTATIKATENVTEAREREHKENIRRIEAEFNLQKKAIEDALKMEGQSVDDKARLEEELKRLQSARLSAMTTEQMRYNRVSRSQMDDLAKTWRDSVESMKTASASWATSFMDRLTTMITGGKFGIKEFAAGISKDLLSIFLKKNLGGFVTDMFGSFGKQMGGLLGLDGGDKPTGKKGDPIYTTSDAADGVSKNPIKEMADEGKKKLEDMWEKVKTGFGDAWDWIKSSLGSVWDSLKGIFSDVGDSIMKMFSSLSSGGDSGGGLFGALGSLFGGGGGEAATVGDDLSGLISLAAANGGVMTDIGPMSLMKYSNGGVANKPQLALFGEGRMPEAYVPLPDGRSIPVTIQGAGQQAGNNVVISITVNKDGTQSESSAGDDQQAWTRVAQRVRGVVMEELVTQQRPGGVLYK